MQIHPQSENPNEAPDAGTTYAWKDLQIAAFSYIMRPQSKNPNEAPDVGMHRKISKLPHFLK